MVRKEKKPLAESLVEEGIITPEQLKQAQEEEKRTGLRLRNVLVRLGFIAEEDLPALYRETSAFVFPSHYEGFGLPPVECLACGRFQN